MTINIDSQSDELNSLLICSVRYCLGRATYMPSVVIEFIRPLIKELPYNTINVMIRDIEEYGMQYKTYGWDIDTKLWLDFLDELKNR